MKWRLFQIWLRIFKVFVPSTVQFKKSWQQMKEFESQHWDTTKYKNNPKWSMTLQLTPSCVILLTCLKDGRDLDKLEDWADRNIWGSVRPSDLGLGYM